MKLTVYGVDFITDFQPGEGGDVPSAPGIYAEIHWPTRTIRIGESKNMRSRNRGALRWYQMHFDGTHNEKEKSRKGPIVDLAKKWGAQGLEHFVMSADPRLEDRELRVACEQQLHKWAGEQTDFTNINRQRGYRTVN